MLNGLYLSAMGARVQDARADVASNNLANVNTTAFRRDQAVFRLRPSASESRPGLRSLERPGAERVGGGVFLERVASYAENGPLEQTGQPLDLAIDGEGFLKVRAADGALHYTRAGNLRRDPENFLVTADGRYRVQGPGGGDIELPDGLVDINEAGEIFQNGRLVTQIGLVMPADPGRLRKMGDNLWTTDGLVPDVAATGKIRHGFREGSAVEPVKEMTELIQAQRTYELNLRALRIQDEILARAVSDIGRVNG